MYKTLALELYKLFRGEMLECFALHRTALQNYLAFAAAIGAASIAGLIQSHDSGLVAGVVVCGPLLNICICIIGVRTCNRFYLGALERIAIVTKLEHILQFDLRRTRTDQEQGSEGPPLPGDDYILPVRWRKVVAECTTTDEFVHASMPSGVNLLARRTFEFVIAMNVALAVAVVFLLIK
jgi:hypothetical protein